MYVYIYIYIYDNKCNELKLQRISSALRVLFGKCLYLAPQL